MTNTDIADDVYWGQTHTHQQRQRMRVTTAVEFSGYKKNCSNNDE